METLAINSERRRVPKAFNIPNIARGDRVPWRKKGHRFGHVCHILFQREKREAFEVTSWDGRGGSWL